jgi:hypothetical protein
LSEHVGCVLSCFERLFQEVFRWGDRYKSQGARAQFVGDARDSVLPQENRRINFDRVRGQISPTVCAHGVTTNKNPATRAGSGSHGIFAALSSPGRVVPECSTRLAQRKTLPKRGRGSDMFAFFIPAARSRSASDGNAPRSQGRPPRCGCRTALARRSPDGPDAAGSGKACQCERSCTARKGSAVSARE